MIHLTDRVPVQRLLEEFTILINARCPIILHERQFPCGVKSRSDILRVIEIIDHKIQHLRNLSVDMHRADSTP